MKDPVRDFLRERGCSDHVIKGGLEGLVKSWEKTVRSVENGYALELYDYLNDLDARQLIFEVLPVAGKDQSNAIAARLDRADKTMRDLTRPTPVSLWGREVTEEKGWTPSENWWYFARPVQAEPELLAEIDDLVRNSETAH